ncbi:hypothetical protein C4D60_Mb09t15910 [Musa balbisiana]|uniref:Uncharacterized protein n=1 Tax=Musa balbisiana TaxID=52838 RepID=A0A4S8II41_MUSBA|nr:hypothetical protein C4D60_Mb09t15910 [Musa balbisiana]
MIPSRPCVATNSEIGAGEEDEIERRSFARPTQLSRSSKAPTFAPQAIDPVVGPCPQIVDCSNLDGESREVPLESFWSFRSYSSARPIVRAGMEGINGARRQKMSRFKNARGVRRSFE